MPASRASRVLGTAAVLVLATPLTAVATGVPATAAVSRTVLISVNAAGAPGDQQSGSASVTPDGRFVAFESYAANLVPGDGNGQRDVFLRDRRRGTVELISVGRAGGSADGDSRLASTAISADGRFVVFRSTATDLVAGVDGNGIGADAYVRDRLTRTTARVNGDITLTHNESPSISGDGRFVAFVGESGAATPGDADVFPDVFVYDRRSATVRRANLGPGGARANEMSSSPVLSGNGRYVAFVSHASNLVTGDSHDPDMFVRDLRHSRTEKVSYDVHGRDLDGGVRGVPSISSDGRLVTFSAADLQVYVRDRSNDVTTLVTVGPDGGPRDQFSHTPMLSPSGRYVTFHSGPELTPPDRSMLTIYRRDLVARTTERLGVHTVDGARVEGGAYLYATSNHAVVFSSSASNLGAGNDPAPGHGYSEQLYLVNW